MKDINILKNNGIDVEKGIELLGDMEMYEDTLQDFLDGMDERLPKIEEYYGVQDMENYAIEVHAMKSDANYLGMTELGTMALEHQLKSQANDITYIQGHYEELVAEANRVIKLVKKYLDVSN